MSALSPEILLPLAEEIFIDEKPAYYAFAADSEKLTGAEVMARYGVGATEQKCSNATGASFD